MTELSGADQTFRSRDFENTHKKNRWRFVELLSQANQWFAKQRKIMRRRVSEKSPWWNFVGRWPKRRAAEIQAFITGQYCFSPMIAYSFEDEGIRVWEYADRLMLKLLWQIISPVAKKIISRRCYHLCGPKGVQTCLKHLRNCLEKGRFNYVIRGDIKGYYASIPRHLLLNQLLQHFQDPRLQNYWEQIVNIPVNCNANIINPTHGIPRRSTLSPFFGALYLSPLDKAIEKLQGIEYFRYMDDIIILAKTRKQYRLAKKILFETLKALQLTLSPTKTKMGPLTNFHFLGGDFSVSRNTVKKIQTVHTKLHQRSCVRALERLRQLRDNAANAATRQRYLLRWARWWQSALEPISINHLIRQWILIALTFDHSAVWLARAYCPGRWAGVESRDRSVSELTLRDKL